MHLLPDFARGGGQQVLLGLIEGMQETGVEHLVCGLGDGPMQAEYGALNIATVALPNEGRLGRTVVELVRLARRSRVDLIHTNDTPRDRLTGQAVALCCRLPMVNTFHGCAAPPLPAPERLSGLPRFLLHRARRGANARLVRATTRHFIAVSAAARDARCRYFGLDPSQVTVVPPGVRGAFFRTPPEAELGRLRHELGAVGRSPVLIGVGRLEPAKGQRDLLEMADGLRRRWPRLLLLLAGDGPDRPLLQAWIGALGLQQHVRLLGERTDLPLLLAAADLFVSASRVEGFGLAVLEAMAAGRPVAAYHTPAYDDFLDSGRTALLVAEHRAQALLDAADRILRDPDLARRLAAAARCKASELSARTMARRVLDIYRTALPGRHPERFHARPAG